MKKKETITLIYFRDKSGKARTFKMARSVFIVLVFLAFLIPGASVYFGLMYKVVSDDLRIRLVALERENASVRQSLKAIETKRLEFIPSTQKPNVSSSKPDDFDSKTINTGQVDANNLEVTNFEERKILIVSFDVIKSRIADVKMAGYVFIVWKMDDNYYCLPQTTEIKNGTPVKYTAGEGFDIKNQKHFTKTLSATLDKLRLLYILIYDNNGTIILKKNVDLRS
ncbi:MAG: hypothetical protein HQL03_12610 [Nitrospirae bacterium]|nr:hypothetical protein [Nitrospirota bacterium]MBF0591111.1 hypothetical protein [Nitrospirota bacterium]